MVPSDEALRTDVVAALSQFATAPVRLQTYRNGLYLLLAFLLGNVYLIVGPALLALGLGLTPLLIGLPILALLVAFALVAAGVERRLAGALLDRPVEGSVAVAADSWHGTLRELVTDHRTWTPLLYLPLKFVVGVLAIVVGSTGLSTGLSMLFVPLYYDQPGLYVGLVTERPIELHPALYVGWNNLLVGFETVFDVGYWEIDTLPAALLVAVVGLAVCLVSVAVLNGLARLTGWLTAVLLSGGYDPLCAMLND